MSITKSEIVAAIDVGSNSIRMKIAEVKANGKIIVLEDLRKTINLGRDTFSQGIIETETVQRTCDILSDFKKLIKEYKIKTFRAVSTSAVREAANRDYILDQIKVKTGMDIEVLNNAQERFITYKSLRDKLDNYSELKKSGMLIVDIGSGGVETSLYKNGYLNYTENIKVGSLRLREILYDLERKTINFPSIMEKFVDSKIYTLKPEIKKQKIKNYIGLGGELKVITILCHKKIEDLVKITREELWELYDRLKNISTQEVILKYGISSDRAEILLPSVIIFKKFMEITDAECILAPLVSLRDGIISEIADSKYKSKRKKEAVADIISSAKCMASKYDYDDRHAKQVESIALEIFDNTKKLHGMQEQERFYLQMSAVLHDIGKFISLNNHTNNSYSIILSSNIIGLSEADLNVIANIVKYHSEENPSIHEENYKKLNHEERIMVSKLAAILKLADSMDISHEQCIKDINIITDEDMIVRVIADRDITLEQWTFENRAEFFYEVFGVRPIIKKKVR